MPQQKAILTALRGELPARVPIWLMRQAGRYLPEYRELRGQAPSFLDLCYTPALATEITLQPVRRFGMDAAILFSDIFVVPDALGWPVRFIEGQGPKLERFEQAGLARLKPAAAPAHLAPVYETVAAVRAKLPSSAALIGFAGAPWTVAAYMLEGGSSNDGFARARAFGQQNPAGFGTLLDILTEATIAHLSAQVEAGAEALQLFDSWAGALAEPQFEAWCQAPAGRIVAALRARHPDVPVIAFPRGAGVLYPRYAAAVQPAGLALDTTVPPSWARAHLPGCCLQGNLDPAALLAGAEVAVAGADRILAALADGPFIFNLGHGVLPPTDPATVAALVDRVHAHGLAAGGAAVAGNARG